MTRPVLPPSSAASRRRSRSRVTSSNGVLGTLLRRPRQEDPGQRDVLELAQVTEVVISGQALFARPAERLAQCALRDPGPRLQGRDRPHVGEEVAHVPALGLVEQVEGAAQIPFSLAYPGHRGPPAIAILRQPVVLAQLLALQQLLRSGPQIAALEVDLAHPHVHVGRSPQDGPVLLGGTLQGPLVGVHRLTETALGDPDVRHRDRAAEDIGDVPGPP